MPENVTLYLEDIGDSMSTQFYSRDLWAQTNLSSAPVVNQISLPTEPHGVRLLRFWPIYPETCPAGFTTHAAGYWKNTEAADLSKNTLELCAEKCREMGLRSKSSRGNSGDCVAFELTSDEKPACYLFLNSMQEPFTSNPGASTCVRD